MKWFVSSSVRRAIRLRILQHQTRTCVSQTGPGINSCSEVKLFNQSTPKVSDRGQTVHVSKLEQGYLIIVREL